MSLDSTRNFAVATIQGTLLGGATGFNVGSGEGALFPTVASEGAFNAVVWNVTDYSDPSLDPSHEIVRVTAISTDTFTVTRGQESTTDQNHNIPGRVYKVALVLTRKMITDIGARLIDQAGNYAIDSGSANAYAISFTGTDVPTALVAGQTFRFKAANANTGASTLNVQGLGAKAIIDLSGAPLSGGAIPANSISTVTYDGTSYQLQTNSIQASVVQGGTYNFATDTGSANAYAVALNPAIAAYASGQVVRFIAANTNTGASTLNVNSKGAKNIKVYIGASLADPPANSILSGAWITCIYDGTQFLLQGISGITAERLVSISNPSSASSLALTGLATGTRYRMKINLLWNTSAGDLRLRFNNDTGAHYLQSAWFSSSGGNFTYDGGSAFGLISGGGPVKAAEQIIAEIEFQTTPGNTQKAQMMGKSGYIRNAASDEIICMVSAKYNGSADVTEIDLVASAGTFTGQVLLFALNG